MGLFENARPDDSMAAEMDALVERVGPEAA